MKRIINTLLFMFAAITMTAQTSFVVADKNGNSQLVQSLIFQQQQNADRFTWKSDGTASGDIKDVFFIARAQAELATANSDEINQIMESVSEAGMADAEALAAALKENTSVEEAFTEDGNNVVTKLSGADHYLVYPTYKIESPFSELDLASDAAPAKARFMPKKSAGGRGQSVAIFNFFDGMEEYDVQNQIAMSIYDAFNDHHYDVQYYGPSQPDASRRFTYTHLYDVLQKSQDYAAIIIFSHGTTINGTGYLATEDEGIGLYQMPINGKNYQLVSTESMLTGDYKVDNNCILYLGVCDGVSSEGFKSSVKAPVIGYSGKTCMAEANAAIFFHLMLFEGYSREEAYNHLMPEPNNAKTEHHKTEKINYLKIAYDDELRTQYIENCTVSFVKYDSYYADSDDWQHMAAGIISGGQIPMMVRVRLMPILERYYWDGYQTNVSKISGLGGGNTFSSTVHIKGQPEGIYKYVVEGVLKDPKTGKPVYDEDGFKEWRRVKPESQRLVVYSKNYKSHGEEPTVPDEDTAAPVVLGSYGQPVDEITLSANSSQSFNIDGYSGHTLKALSFDEDVVTVSVSGTTLTVTGVSEGFALIGTYDVQNLLMDVIKVTVTAGGDMPDVSPGEAIDLGLPSGLKWASCNVGASKPEEYGGYYAWGETEEKDYYDWSTYKWCNGDEYSLTKYCTNSSYGIVDNKTVLDPEDDVAHVKWGGDWRMPTVDEFDELFYNTTSEWISLNGVIGRKFTSKTNGNSIFFPAAGNRTSGYFNSLGGVCYYWLSSMSNRYYAYQLYSDSGNWGDSSTDRDRGRSVRPVRKN